MKQLLITIAAVMLVGCGDSQSTEPTTGNASDISLIEAAAKGNIEAVKQHLAAGIDANAQNAWGSSALSNAAFDDHLKVAELLVDNGADVNAKDYTSTTSLHVASQEGSNKIVKFLFAKGADVNAKDENYQTPLDWAIKNKRTETADLLRKHGGKTGEELKAEEK